MAESSSCASQRKLDVISLRMARLDPKVPWGFSVKPPRVVDKVQGGGLADRAGLQSGDHIDEIRGESSPTFFRVNEVINEPHNQLDLTVLREPTVTRIWRPNVTDLTNNQVGNRVQNANERNVKVSLEHQKLQPDLMRGFNSGPRQFGSNLQQKSDNPMKSEVLRMIQENEQHRGQRPQNFANKGLLPNCFCCGRPIVGVMVTAFDLSLHSDCFQCSTCGTNLANQGHHFLNDKFYCDVHGRQRKVQLGDRLGADKQKSSSAAPLTQQVRPFNSNSVNGNTLPSARRDNKNALKSGLHRRPRQRLRQEWPPPPGAIKRNAEAIRFWKYHFEKEGHPSEETLQHLKERITDFETGRMLNPTSNRVPLERGPYSKYVLLTPERLHAPMRKNPFAFPNAEPPKNPVINSSMDSSMILPPRQESADDGTTTRWQFLGQSDLDTEILSASSTPSIFLPTLPAPLQINESIEDFEKRHFGELAKLTPVRQQDSAFAPPQESAPKLGRQLSTIQMASSKPVQIVSSLQNQLNPGEDDSPSTDELEFQQLNDVSNHKASRQPSQEQFQDQLEKRLKEVDEIQRQEDKLNSQNDSVNKRGRIGPGHSKIPPSHPPIRSQITIQSNDSFLAQIQSDPQKASDSTPSQPRDDVMTMSTTPTVILEEDDMATVTGSPVHMPEYEQQLKEVVAANEELAREAAATPVANSDKSMQLSVMEDAKNDIDAIYRSFELLERQIEEWAKERKNNGETLARSTELDGHSTKGQPNPSSTEMHSLPHPATQPLTHTATMNATRAEPMKIDEKRKSFYDLAGNFPSNSIQNTNTHKTKLPQVPQRSHSRQQNHLKATVTNESPRKHKKPKEKRRKSPRNELSKSAADLTEAHSIIYADIRPYRSHVQRAEHVHREQSREVHSDPILSKTKLNIQLKTVEQQQPVQKIDFSSLNEFDNMEPLYDQPHLESRWNTMTPRSGVMTPNTVQRSFSFDLPPPLPPIKLGNGQKLSKPPSESALKPVPPVPPKHGRRQRNGESLEALKILSDLCKNIESGTISRPGTLSRRNSENLRHYDEEERPFKRVPIDSNEVNRLSSAFTGLRTRGPVTKPQAFNEPSRWTPNDVLGPNTESPKCAECRRAITGSFVKAAGKTYCPEHFNCANGACNRRLIECGFVEENGKKYCEKCFETLIAPDCAKCGLPITAECLNALQKHWHPQCFTCTHCRQSFGNAAFYVENNKPYCERDWNQLFTAKCTSCTFPIEAGDKWVEALGGQFHTNCFNCTICHISLEGQTFYAREGRPFCKSHA